MRVLAVFHMTMITFVSVYKILRSFYCCLIKRDEMFRLAVLNSQGANFDFVMFCFRDRPPVKISQEPLGY